MRLPNSAVTVAIQWRSIGGFIGLVYNGQFLNQFLGLVSVRKSCDEWKEMYSWAGVKKI